MRYVIFGVVVLLFFCSTLHALPKYTIQEKERCGYCHVSQHGGGPLNHRGRFYSKKHGFEGYQTPEELKAEVLNQKQALKSFKEKKKAIQVAKKKTLKKPLPVKHLKPSKPPKIKVPSKPPILVAKKEKKEIKTEKSFFGKLWDNTNFYGNARFWYMIKKGGPMPRNFFFMQVEPGLASTLLERLNFVFSYNIPNPLVTAFLQYEFMSKHYVQAGSFHIPMGMDYEDHTAFLIDQLHIGIDTRDIGIMFGSSQDFFYKLAVTEGHRRPLKRVREPSAVTRSDMTYVGNVGYRGNFLKMPALFGFSFMYEQGAHSQSARKRDIQVYDTYLTFTRKKLTFLGELAYANEKPIVDRDSISWYGGLEYDIITDLSLLLRYDWYAEDVQFLRDFTHRGTLGGRWKFWEYAALESYFRYEESFNAGTNIRPNSSFYIMTHLFF